MCIQVTIKFFSITYSEVADFVCYNACYEWSNHRYERTNGVDKSCLLNCEPQSLQK